MTQSKKQHIYSVDSADWKGYTLEEIRYARAFVAARMEISKERLNARVRAVSEKGFMGDSPTGIFGKILSAFSYLDIALITWKLGSRVFKFTRALRR